jgi:hypothetical protein
MRPAVLTDSICGGRIESLAAAQLLDQLTTQLSLLGLLPESHFELSQPVASAADH